MCLIMARRWDFAWPWRILSESPRLFPRTATHMRKASAQGWNPIQRYWREPAPLYRAAVRDFFQPGTTERADTPGRAGEWMVAPECDTPEPTLPAPARKE